MICLCLTCRPIHAQALQWAFAAVPGHPALKDVCNHIKRNVVTRFSDDAQHSILERRWLLVTSILMYTLHGSCGNLAELLDKSV